MTSLRSKSIDKWLKDACIIMTHTKITVKILNFKHNFYLIWTLNKNISNVKIYYQMLHKQMNIQMLEHSLMLYYKQGTT